jgi:cytochrome c oxidase subunit 2
VTTGFQPVASALQSALDAAGPGTARFETLFWLFVIVCGLVFLAVLLVLLWAAFRRRERGGAPMPYPDNAQERRLNRVVGGATAVTLAILVVFVVASFATDRGLAQLTTKEGFEVKVTGHQWWWEVTYQDENPSRSFTTANELHIPVGVPVRVSLDSPDVIHSFWVPSLNGKTDLIPGRENTTTIQADRPGTYRGQCAEYCGLQHAHMAFLVVAEPREAFEAWRERQIRPAPEPAGDLEKRGRDVFLSGPCVMCHKIRGTIAGGSLGPDLTHLAGRQTLAAATIPNTPGHLAAWIEDPQHVKPGNRMPITQVAPSDMHPLLAYLETLE